MIKLISCKYLTIVILFIFCFTKIPAQNSFAWTKDKFETHIKDYSSFWIKDSVADNGYRMMLYLTSFFTSCTIEGQKWSKWEKVFGKPGKTIQSEKGTDYLYRLTNFGESFFSSVYIVIVVDKQGIITKLLQIEPCG